MSEQNNPGGAYGQNNQAGPAGQKNALGMDDKTTSWFAYIISVISAIIVLVTVKDNRNVRIHAWQSLFFGGVYWVLIIILGIIRGIILASITGWDILVTGRLPAGAVILGTISWLLGVGFVLVSVFCILKAAKGDILKLPVIYPYAEKMK